jgi:hypothetical protein
MDATAQRRIAELEAENATLRQRVAQLEATLEELLRRLTQLETHCEELERAAHRQAAPFRRPEKKRQPPETQRRIGRPAGHPPAWRHVPAHIDETIAVPLPHDAAGQSCCPQCGGAVEDVQPCTQYIEDLPPIRPHVTQLTTYTATCAHCGPVRSTHPQQVSTARGAAGTQLGWRALSLAAWLNKHLGLTTRATCRVLRQLGGLRVTPGGLTQALARVAERLQPAWDELQQGLRQQAVTHADETSWWIAGKQAWLWVFTTAERTLYRLAPGRGRDVVLDTLGSDYAGVLVSDCLASYENLPYRMHKCYAHHLRAIAELRDRAPPEQRAEFDELKALLTGALAVHALRSELSAEDYARCRVAQEAWADRLLGPRSGPVEKAAARLRKRRAQLFTFLDVPGVEPTNNRAERALRPAVIARKLSCGNKTERGARTWEVLASLAATAAQRGHDFVAWLTPQLALQPAVGR